MLVDFVLFSLLLYYIHNLHMKGYSMVISIKCNITSQGNQFFFLYFYLFFILHFNRNKRISCCFPINSTIRSRIKPNSYCFVLFWTSSANGWIIHSCITIISLFHIDFKLYHLFIYKSIRCWISFSSNNSSTRFSECNSIEIYSIYITTFIEFNTNSSFLLSWYYNSITIHNKTLIFKL